MSEEMRIGAWDRDCQGLREDRNEERNRGEERSRGEE